MPIWYVFVPGEVGGPLDGKSQYPVFPERKGIKSFTDPIRIPGVRKSESKAIIGTPDIHRRIFIEWSPLRSGKTRFPFEVIGGEAGGE